MSDLNKRIGSWNGSGASGVVSLETLRRHAEYERRVLELRALGVPEKKAHLILELCSKVSQTMISADAFDELYTACKYLLIRGDMPSEVYNWIQDKTL
jgi:hypothetical protein